MELKKNFKKMRDGLQQLIYKVINPFVYGMIKIGITPNMVTTIGFLGNVLAAAMMVYATTKETAAEQFYWVAWSGATIIIFSLFDMLDGQVARLGNMVSKFGAMYDSVLDRYCELFTLGGITYFLMATGYETGAIITFLAMIGSVMVSYVRARAEGLDIECKIGFMQRPERVVVTSLSALGCGIYGCNAIQPAFDPMFILIVAMGIIAVFANITAFARIAHCKGQLTKK
ncbi:MAG: CDP-alcohol phosphatidyltransferase family protein [Muribaculaceae bacterium]|nr:CDP-alcohol phosphatidyltransferase family protein [Muribaculaceae bacterium]